MGSAVLDAVVAGPGPRASGVRGFGFFDLPKRRFMLGA